MDSLPEELKNELLRIDKIMEESNIITRRKSTLYDLYEKLESNYTSIYFKFIDEVNIGLRVQDSNNKLLCIYKYNPQKLNFVKSWFIINDIVYE